MCSYLHALKLTHSNSAMKYYNTMNTKYAPKMFVFR